MTAYEILTLGPVALDMMTNTELAAARARLTNLVALGFRDVCGLSLVDGIARLDAENDRRTAYLAELVAHEARHGGDTLAALMCGVLSNGCTA